MHKQRLAEDLEFKQDTGQFIIRKRSLPLWQLIGLFLVSFAILFIVTTQSHLFGGYIGIALAILAVIGPLCWFTVYFSQHNRDMLLAAEFQNALFSAAARIKARFVMIVKDDGTVVYYDQGFTQSFPESKNRGTLFIDKVFSSEQISRADAEKLFSALESHRAETIFIQLALADGTKEKLIVTLDPLPRPSGFTLIRGRDYTVRQFERNSDSAKPVPVREEILSPALLPALDAMQDGLALWNSEGQIIYLNFRLKTLLGYAGEHVLPSLRLGDILENAPSLESSATEGEQAAQLLSRNGEKLACHARFLPRQNMQNAEATHCALFTFSASGRNASIPS